MRKGREERRKEKEKTDGQNLDLSNLDDAYQLSPYIHLSIAPSFST
jgi:hypothetical protein